jgi:hypothetical protein
MLGIAAGKRSLNSVLSRPEWCRRNRSSWFLSVDARPARVLLNTGKIDTSIEMMTIDVRPYLNCKTMIGAVAMMGTPRNSPGTVPVHACSTTQELSP